MGCCGSKSNGLSHLDDSVKVMVRHDAKALAKKGKQPGGYVPRSPHPMLSKRNLDVENDDDVEDKGTKDLPPTAPVVMKEDAYTENF